MKDAADDRQPRFEVKACVWRMFQIFRTRFGFFAWIGVTGSLLMLMPAYVLQRTDYEEGPIWLLLLLSDLLVALIVTAVMHSVFGMGADDVRAGRPVD